MKSLIPIEKFLRASYENPEPDYVGGALVERPAPTYLQSRTQIRLADALRPWEEKKLLFRASEIRLRVGGDRFRVADFAVFASAQLDAIPEDVPAAVVEIVSPDDRYEELMRKLADYEAAGVAYLFVADPPVRRLSRYLHGDLLAVPAPEAQEHGVRVPLASIFD
jgi:Uma2 family endonuclease